jgi:REP element-mobilizing transposase RayT
MKTFYCRHLPHWQPPNAVFFVTFRLKNSLPYEIIESLQAEKERAFRSVFDDQHSFERWEEQLHKADFGPRWLAQPEIARIVQEAFHYRDGKVFDLHAYCIMSNHVHLVFEPLSTSECHSDVLPLYKILQSLKRHTARQANLVLGREGAFWQDESYDRVIRDQEEYTRIIQYVLQNPVKAGLVSQWEEGQWTYCKPEV